MEGGEGVEESHGGGAGGSDGWLGLGRVMEGGGAMEGS